MIEPVKVTQYEKPRDVEEEFFRLTLLGLKMQLVEKNPMFANSFNS
jgi:hypothetical protein